MARWNLALFQKPGVLLLDVRTEAEHRERSIPGTDTLIPVQELAGRRKELEPYKHRPVLVYCRSGNRSLQAAKLLKENGIQDVTDLKGGIGAWASHDLCAKLKFCKMLELTRRTH